MAVGKAGVVMTAEAKAEVEKPVVVKEVGGDGGGGDCGGGDGGGDGCICLRRRRAAFCRVISSGAHT